MRMLRPQLALAALLCSASLWSAPAAHAVSCTMSTALSASDRTRLQTVAAELGSDAARGDTAVLQASSAPFLAKNFADLATVVSGLAPELKGSTITVDSLYLLQASDLAEPQEAQFFCSRPSSPLLVTVTLGQVPPAEYALAVIHASGVAAPQQFALILQNGAGASAAPQWQLAGFFVRPLTIGNHSELWFWEQARDLKNKGALLSAYLYYQTAAYLARPADLYTSGNLDKLDREMDAAEPKGLPGAAPMELAGPNGEAFAVTGLRIDTSLGAMDLRVDANVPALGDPVASRKTALAVMSALLAKYPGLRGSFHGIWLFAKAKNGQAYAVEQPMSALS